MHRKRTKLIPLTVMERFHIVVRNFFIHMRTSVLLPYPVYFVYVVFLLFQSCLSISAGMNDKIWPDSSKPAVIFRLLTTITKVGFIGIDYHSVLIEEVVSYSLIVLLNIPAVVAIIIFRNVGRVNNIFLTIVDFIYEFIFPILITSCPTQIGFFIGCLISEKSDISQVFSIASIVVRLIIWILSIFFYHNYLYSQLAYYPGSSLTWSGSSLTFVRLSIDAILIVSRIAEVADGEAVFYCLIILVIFSLISFLIDIRTSPFIKITISAFHCSGQIIAAINGILGILRYKGINCPISIIITVFHFGIVILFVLFTKLFKKVSDNDIKTLAAIEAKDLKFAKAYKNYLDFLRAVRTGFARGNPYVLTWKPFEKALKRWPNNQIIWNQYIRFVAIYVEQSNLLIRLQASMKNMRNKSLFTKSILAQVKNLLNSRNRHMSKELKLIFKGIDEKIRHTKGLLVSYWNSIIDNSISSAYNLASQLHKDFEERESDFQHLINLSPNNHAVCQKYSQFLSNIMCDPLEAAHWEVRAKFLKTQKSILVDYNQMFGFKSFPLLPPEANVTIDDITMTRTYHQTTDDVSVNSVNSSSRYSQAGQELDDIQLDSTPSTIRTLGISAPISFIQVIYLIVVLFFVFAFFLTPFLPSFIMMTGVNKLTSYIEPVSKSSELFSCLSVLNLFFIETGLRNNGSMLSVQDELLLLNAKAKETIVDEDKIKSTITNFNNLAQKTEQLFRQNVAMSKAGFNELDSHVTIEKASLEYNVSLFEAINSLASNAFKFDAYSNYVNSEWYTEFTNNVDKQYDLMASLIIDLSEDMPDMIYNYINIASIATYACIAISAILFIIYIITVLKIKRKWEYIIQTINSVPRVAIQNFLSLQTQKQEEEFTRAEFRYSSVFTQMIASRDTSNGLPIGSLIRIGILNMVFAIIFVVVILLIVNQMSPTIGAVGVKFYYLNNLLQTFFTTTSSLMRLHFYHDFSLSPHILLDIDELKIASQDFLFSEWYGQPSNFLATDRTITKFLLSVKDTNWASYSSLHERLLNTARIDIISIIISCLDILSDKVIVDPKNNFEFMFAVHFVSDHIYTEIISPIVQASAENLSANLLLYLFLCSAILLIIGIIVASFVIYQLHQVELTVKFCLSSLSMLKPHYIKDSKNIMELLSGNFQVSIIHNHSLDAPLEKVGQVIKENVITTDNQARVKYMNITCLRNFQLNLEDWKKAHLSLLFEIDEPTFMETIERIAKYGEPKSYFSNGAKKLKILSNQRELSYSVEAFHIDFSNQEACVLIMKDINESINKQQELSDLIKQADQMRVAIIPKILQSKYESSTKQMKLISHNVFIAAIEYIGFDDLVAKTSPTEAFKIINQHESALSRHADSFSDVIVVTRIGSTSFILFNVLRQSSNSYEIATEMIRFAKSFVDNNPNTEVRMGFGLSKNLTLALRSEKSVQFDAYSKVLHTIYSMARQAPPSSVIMGTNLFEFLPIQTSHQAKQVQVTIEGQQQWCRSLNFRELKMNK